MKERKARNLCSCLWRKNVAWTLKRNVELEIPGGEGGKRNKIKISEDTVKQHHWVWVSKQQKS
jgi:hypothetical protein